MSRIDALLERGAGTAVALVHGDERWSYARLARAASAWAAELGRAGVRPGDRVVLYAEKLPGFVAALFGAWRAGAVAVPANPVLKAPQVAHMVADSGARVMVTTALRWTLVAGALEGVRPLLIGADDPAGMADAGPAGPHDLAALLYTSGSTGRPKGVMLSHANLWHAADSVATYLGLAADDVALAILPLSFDAGLSVLTSAMMAGGTTVLLDYLAPADVVAAVMRHQVTTISGVPPLFVQLAEGNWPAQVPLRRLTVTGGRMPEPLTRRVRALFPEARLHLMYGLTEAFRALQLDPELVDRYPGSVGRAIPHAEVAIVRPDGSRARPDEPGELVQAGPLVAQGYWGDPQRTRERFRPAPAWMRSGGMAVFSGDTLRCDAQGLHWFVGRDDEMIKTSGYRVSPTEVEEAALGTGVLAEAVALGVPDARLGQAILLVAVPRGGLAPEAVEAQLVRGLAGALPAFMRPARILWRQSLPRNPNGKIDRAALRADPDAAG
jgi:amino acid adenylation domain-containing protein